MNYVFADTITQVYESNGNLHIVGGVASGDIDTKGNDVLEKTLHLIIPMNKAIKILPEISDAIPKLIDNTPHNEKNISSPAAKNEDEIEGEGLHFKI